jgi:hypothetical protein
MSTAKPPPGAYAVDGHNGLDPFVTSSQDAHRQRYSAFDNSQFSLYLTGSPAQAKRALQAHLAETTRRLQETSHLGNALVQQRKELEEKLQEVDTQEADADIGPELRARLSELEKEFNEVGRETARAFLPKSRVPSGETDATAGGSVFTSEAQNSPSKVSVPSRKQRNQQPSRINDISLATEISTSLLAQLKDLQAVLLEKDESLKAANLDRSQLEIEVEGLSQRLRTLDESESRLKDVNWNLETQVREFEIQSKAAADKEHRLNHNLNLAKTEKSTLERELEELKQLHAKLSDDQSHRTKQHETELSGLRRNVSMGETERGALQRKVEELSTQNQDLAKAVAYRMRSDEQGSAEEISQEEGDDEGNTITPEHSPPSSPTKATPRHGQLESETLKHSLHHAHRMIQQLKNNIHREKTEKMELKRMLQDARDELVETTRTLLNNGPGSASKRRKNDKDAFKKPARPDRLGALRDSQEIVVAMADEEWEDHDDLPNTPSKRPKQADVAPGAFSTAEASATEGFETANETSDAAFETANEREGTSTDAFQTGAETLDGNSSDDLTETEAGPSRGTVRYRPSTLAMAGHRDSYESTASTSGDEWNDKEAHTPVQPPHPRYRLKVRQGYRRSTRGSQDFYPDTPSAAKASPSSFASHSNKSTPVQGQSLLAELGDLSGGESEDGSAAEITPSRSSVLSPESSPEGFRKPSRSRSPLHGAFPRPAMVDSGVMTEPWEPASSIAETPLQSIDKSFIWSQNTQPESAPLPVLHISSLLAQDTAPQNAPAPSLRLAILSSQGTEPQSAPRPFFQRSTLVSQDTAPVSIPLRMSSLSAQGTTPRSPPPHVLDMSSHSAQGTIPESAPIPSFSMSTVSSQDSIPQHPPRPSFAMSSVSSQDTIPQHPPRPLFAMSSHSVQGTDPVLLDVGGRAILPLNVSTIMGQTTEPREAHTSMALAGVALTTAGLASQTTEPMDTTSREVEPKELPQSVPLSMTSLSSQTTVPSELPQPSPLSMSGLFSQTTGPIEWQRPVAPQISAPSAQSTAPVEFSRPLPQMSTLTAQSTTPIELSRPMPQMSTLSVQNTEPVESSRPFPRMSALSTQTTAPVESSRPLPRMSAVSAQSTQPIQLPVPDSSRISSISSLASDPIELPRPAVPRLSVFTHQETSPVDVPGRSPSAVSIVAAHHTVPMESHLSPQALHRSSDVSIIHDTQAESPTLPDFLPSPSRPSTATFSPLPALSFSEIATRATEPYIPSRPVTAHRAVPFPLPVSDPWGKTSTETSSTTAIQPNSREARVPLASITSNTTQRERGLNDGRSSPAKQVKKIMADGGTQTMVSSDQIDRLLLARGNRYSGTIATADIEKAMSPPASPSRRNSNDATRPHFKRRGSSSSNRSRGALFPPLPADHKEVIAAASLKSPALPPPTGTNPASGKMGPPEHLVSHRTRPQTPTIKTTNAPSSPKTIGTTPTPRARPFSQPRSGAASAMTRQSSVSSFSSEIDQRFNIGGMASLNPVSMDPSVDPRMIQAITQTMFGEFMWKYTRKTGREGISGTRHRRYFWVHPFTRTLYWSKDGPTRGPEQMKAKSVAIESVHVVSDNNPLPPGLHQHSLVVTTPGRILQFTATTSQRHETWYNALLYLLQRTEEGGDNQQLEADEIHDEFNGGLRSSSRQTGHSRMSHMTSTSRGTSSPHPAQYPTLRNVPTLSPNRPISTEPPHGSVTGRLSTMFHSKSNLRGSFSSRLSKASVHEDTATYEEPNSTTTGLGHDLVSPLARSEGFDMEDVRACCNGKRSSHMATHTKYFC